MRKAKSPDCSTALRTGVPIETILSLSKPAVQLLERAYHHREGGGAVASSYDPAVAEAEKAGVVKVRSEVVAGHCRVTLETLCEYGHDLTAPSQIPVRLGQRYCKRCGRVFKRGEI